jgi:hypothetical protein
MPEVLRYAQLWLPTPETNCCSDQTRSLNMTSLITIYGCKWVDSAALLQQQTPAAGTCGAFRVDGVL